MGMTGPDLAPRLTAIDDEIRAVLTQAEPALQPFYGMMLYHLGLDAERSGAGKRLRPLLLVLLYETLATEIRPALPAAAAIELLHNFTLIHDDIEDQDPTRRHRPTVWSVWGVPQAINAGDGMYAASRLAVHRLTTGGVAADRVLEFARLLDAACVQVCEGQFLDISFESRTDVTAERYRAMVAKKTGALFSAAAEGAAVIGRDDRDLREALVRFGADFGHAFQAHDDLLGIWGTTEKTGKVEMNDIAKRKKTLPVVLAFERAGPKVRTTLEDLYAAPAPLAQETVDRVRDILDDLRVRDLIDREIGIHRERALHELRSVRDHASAAEPLRALERLIDTTTGAPSEAPATA
ncbi:MAG: polyprenyl synthetase family protein [Chloroflexi bacterium]|nr:polyprenyl synthetase family protein [Chloroflexota bacterium]MBI2983353.1 polyprenyl synthetase family protein [Chloroflexota bacterium]